MELIRVNWDYEDKRIRNKYIEKFISIYNQLEYKMCNIENVTPKITNIKNLNNELDSFSKLNKDIYLYFKDQVLIGYIILTPATVKDVIWISELCVDKEYRNEGYGSFIIKDIIKLTKQLKYKRICLDVHENNKIAKSLYENNGFNARFITMELKL